MQNFNGLRIIGTGHYAPDNVVTNDDLSKIVDKTLLVSRQNNRSFVDTFEIRK